MAKVGSSRLVPGTVNFSFESGSGMKPIMLMTQMKSISDVT